ncbi:RloB domain-containing protein [Helicobacter sp. 13S00477-4]|uniref:RloB domain-containing protein n=1 Tax=Helicobacter sp. 13S00477-4 TaxID=1905759 RepID=UPI000BD3B5AC|nr:RloB domain-containing protein [Helicobacter sp. 13S00477-4]PAF51993.1 hypothetical protein BKH44_04855 [Helicobacter sp. 13S00477-4]
MSKNRTKKRKVKILCEGESEKYYLTALLESLKSDNYDIAVQNNYKTLNNLIQKNEKIYDIVIVVIDLDIAKDKQELEYLKRLINTLKKRKDKSHIFLTHFDFEDWLRYHFKPFLRKDKLAQRLGCKNPQELKSKQNIYKIIQSKDGDIKNAEEYFKNLPLFCSRELKIFQEYQNTTQSNLYYFRDYMLHISKT